LQLLSLVNFSFLFFVFNCLTIEQFCLKLALNGLPLCEGGDFQHYSSLDAQSLNLALHCHRSTKPPLLQNGC
jgi:hypothetical protein